ncbi:hypothetical protein ATCC90586_003566 [Pythium insidiosum]|nr:hypothetical protein ATCC90586_003566 [Pythium insidiosum]
MMTGSTPRDQRRRPLSDGNAGNQWWLLLTTGKRFLQAFVCLRAWRYVVLRKRRRFVTLSMPDAWALAVFEDQLPLHAVLQALNCGSESAAVSVFELVQEVCVIAPRAPELVDAWRRIPMFYAVEAAWRDQDQLAWLAAKSRSKLMTLDQDGRCVVTHAVLHKCPNEVLMQMAVELVRDASFMLQELVTAGQLESARRHCTRIVGHFLAGVPNFPHAQCRSALLGTDSLASALEVERIWRDFVEKWGHYGMPCLVDDLPPVRTAAIDSFVKIEIKARGEPLRYQWLLDNEPLPDATLPSLLIAQAVQPHNEGIYQCVVSNWKGIVRTTAMRLVVQDDHHGPDPSLRFLLDRASTPLSATDVVHRIRASVGALLVAPSINASLLIPPRCFVSHNRDGVDVSDSTGMDVVVRAASIKPSLKRGEQLVSQVVEILPHSVPRLEQPALLSLPFSWNPVDSCHELVVLEIPVRPDKRVPERRQLDQSRVVSANAGVVTIEISQFDALLAVITRTLPAKNLEDLPPLDDVLLLIAHPSSVNASRQRGRICLSVWAAYNRPDSIDAARQAIASAQPHCRVASMLVQLRSLQWLTIRIGRKQSITHQWRGLDSSGPLCLRDQLSLFPQELALDSTSLRADSGDGDSYVTFFTVDMLVSVRKSSKFLQPARRQGESTNDGPPALFERSWSFLIPLLHDIVTRPPRPSLHQRRERQLAIAYDANAESHRSRRAALFEDLQEAERELTPYFFLVELAKFSETFWQRYDQTWWFDKTKSDILKGMYKTVHAGTDCYAVVATSAFAGAMRVVQCSLDAYSDFSEPFLLEPGFQIGVHEDDDDDAQSVAPGLRRVLKLPATADCSELLEASFSRLHQVLATVYMSCETESSEVLAQLFQDLFGIPCNPEAIAVKLERQRHRYRAANREIALFILGVRRLLKRVHNNLRLRQRFYDFVVERFALLLRLIPEIDCFPSDLFAVTCELHQQLWCLFRVVWKLSSSGWLSHVVTGVWYTREIDTIHASILRMLHNEASELQGASDLTRAFEVAVDDGSCVGQSTELFCLMGLRDFLVLSSGTATDDAVLREARRMCVEDVLTQSAVRHCGLRDEYTDSIRTELASEQLRVALREMHTKDKLLDHIRSCSPAHEVRCDRLPDAVRVRFDIHVIRVNTQHVIKVWNVSLRCQVLGQIEFRREEHVVSFTPSIPFERHTRYQVSLRAQDVETTLGALDAAMVMFEFFTT